MTLARYEKYKAEYIVEGRAMTLTGQGVFVEIEDGIEISERLRGLVDARRSSSRTRLKRPDGDRAGPRIDAEERRLILGMKQLAEPGTA